MSSEEESSFRVERLDALFSYITNSSAPFWWALHIDIHKAGAEHFPSRRKGLASIPALQYIHINQTMIVQLCPATRWISPTDTMGTVTSSVVQSDCKVCSSTPLPPLDRQSPATSTLQRAPPAGSQHSQQKITLPRP